jgi:hypothetical protein
MRYIFLLAAVLLTVTLNSFGQNASPTPAAPNRTESNPAVEKTQNQPSKSPVRLSKPLLKTNNENQQMIVYLVAGSNDNVQDAEYQLKIYYREKRLKEVSVENENQPATLLVDGKLFSPLPVKSDLSLDKNQPSDPFSINTLTVTFDIPKQEAKAFSQANSISIIWKQTTIEISKEGLDVLRQFMTD